jgi:hypothetical protein
MHPNSCVPRAIFRSASSRLPTPERGTSATGPWQAWPRGKGRTFLKTMASRNIAIRAVGVPDLVRPGSSAVDPVDYYRGSSNRTCARGVPEFRGATSEIWPRNHMVLMSY